MHRCTGACVCVRANVSVQVRPDLPLSSLIIAEGDDDDVAMVPNSRLLCQLESARPPHLNSAAVVWPCAYLAVYLGICLQFVWTICGFSFPYANMFTREAAYYIMQVLFHIKHFTECHSIKSSSNLMLKESASTLNPNLVTQVYLIKLTHVGDVILPELLVSVLSARSAILAVLPHCSLFQ